MVRASIFRYVKEFGAVPTDENIQREEVELPPLKNGGWFFFCLPVLFNFYNSKKYIYYLMGKKVNKNVKKGKNVQQMRRPKLQGRN